MTRVTIVRRGILPTCGWLALTCACPALAEDWFVESSAARKLVATYHSGATGQLYFPEIMCGGGAWLDYDADGDLDFYLVQAYELPDGAERGVGNQLFQNDAGTFTDVSAASNTNDRGYGNGVTCGDYDSDGDTDIYVNNLGPNVLYRNNGDGTFTDVTEEAGVGDPLWSIAGAFFDYDLDGDLDLFVVNYMDWTPGTHHLCFGRGGRPDYCGPHSFHRPVPDRLYRNNGDGTFTDVSKEAGFTAAPATGMGATTGDFNGDGRPDIYVTNDLLENQLWLNQGNGTFLDDSLMMGCAVNEMGKTESGMGVCAIDYDDDGDLDLFMVHLIGQTNTFYEFDGEMFDDVTTGLGLAIPSVPYTSFSPGYIDYDNDGLLDLFVGNGRVSLCPPEEGEHPLALPNQLFRLTPQKKYVEVSYQAGPALRLVETTRGSVFGDFDNDGDTDIALVNMDGPLQLLENRLGNKNHWIGFRTRDKYGRHAIGAKIAVTVNGTTRHRWVQRSYSYASSNDPRVLVGLGKSTRVEEILVTWPLGNQERFASLPCDRYVELVEGRGQLVAAAKVSQPR
ncbi:MAG: CRTAC1 family protein [Phycisphaerales bacterium]|nr:MAG: CRTAC1 family protein [Phycisphaerales bacterium]